MIIIMVGYLPEIYWCIKIILLGNFWTTNVDFIKQSNDTKVINPLTPRRRQVSPFTEISILFLEGIIKKISYERRAYESVDEKSLS